MNDYQRIEKIILHLASRYREQPSLAELAKVAGLSEFHFHRLFTRWAGTTPKAFLKYVTAEHAKALLAESRDLLDVSYEVGLSGPGRLHDLLVTVEAMSPGEWKAGGKGIEIRHGTYESPFGKCLIGATSRGVCHLSFGEPAGGLKELKARWPEARLRTDFAAARELAARIFTSKRTRRGKVPLLLAGTSFQLKVWEALLKIPAGHLVAYADVAEAIGAPKAARAVGSAVGDNAIGFLIPCHRVIRQSGVVGDYRWGGDRKRAILGWEAARFPVHRRA